MKWFASINGWNVCLMPFNGGPDQTIKKGENKRVFESHGEAREWLLHNLRCDIDEYYESVKIVKGSRARTEDSFDHKTIQSARHRGTA